MKGPRVKKHLLLAGSLLYGVILLGILSNGGSNTTVFNVTVDSGVNLTGARQQVALARQAVQTAHSGTGNTNLRLLATQLTSSQPPVVTTNSTTTETPNCSNVTFDTTAALGPGTIMTGVNMTVPFFVAAGTTNFNTNAHTEFFVNRQTTITSTTRKSAVYQVLGESTR
jgi:hypothetical protein